MMAALAAWGHHRLQPLRHARFAWRLALLLLVIHSLVEWQLDDAQRAELYPTFGLSRVGMLAGRVWQLLTHGFLHGAWWHVGINAVALCLLGSRLEFWTSVKACVWVTLAGIAGGGVGHLLLGGDAKQILVGISGALFALLACASTLSPEIRSRIIPLTMGQFALLLVVGEGILALANPDLHVPLLEKLGAALFQEKLQISHACHFGGGIAGWLCGLWMLRPRVTLETLRREREKRENGSKS